MLTLTTLILLLLLLLAADIALLIRSSKISLFRLRNIWLAAVIPFLSGAVINLLGYIVTNNTEKLTLLHFLVRYPAVFANTSVLLFLLLAAAMAVSNVVLIRHEGMALKNTVGTVLELIFIAGTVLIYVLVCFLQANRDAQNVFLCYLENFLPFWMYCLIDYCECIMIGIILMGWAAARSRPAYDKDFIIIPGCSISRTGGLLPLLRGRVNRAIRYAWDQEIASGKRVCFIPSGGQGRDEIMSEGSAMGLYLLSHAAEEDEIFVEKQSKNTWENFSFSKEVIDQVRPGAKTAFATTNYHVLRCGILARKAGLDAEGIASSTKLYFWPNGFAREVVAIFVLTKKFHMTAAVAITFLSILLAAAEYRF